MPGSPFRSELFTEPEEYEETPLRDRKAPLPNLGDRRSKAEFIRDVIALANTARLFGRPAYLLFGIEDHGSICGIQVSPIGDGTAATCHFWEQVERGIGQAIAEYLIPAMPNWEIKHGEIEGKQTAYMIIHPLSTAEPFRVRRRFPSHGEILLEAGTCWIRFGESKQRIQIGDINEAPHVYSYAQVPYVLPSMWLRYFDGLLSDKEIAQAGRIPAYQRLFVGNQMVEDVVSEFLEERKPTLLIIRGAAGSGKSAFLRRLAHYWAKAGRFEVQGVRRREEFRPPSQWIPVYFPLRDANISDFTALSQGLLHQVNQVAELWDQHPENPEQLLEYPALKWLVCLDGLDELWDQERRQAFLRALRNFRRRCPRVKVIVTTRPDVSIPSDLRKVDVATLHQEQVLAYIGNYVSGETYEDYVNLLQSEHDLWELCRTPVYLEAALEVLANVYSPQQESAMGTERQDRVVSIENDGTFPDEHTSPVNDSAPELPRVKGDELTLSKPITDQQDLPEKDEEPIEEIPIESLPGQLLDRMYKHLWEREEGRRSVSLADVDRWWDTTGELAMKLDGRRNALHWHEAFECFAGETGLDWILSLGILRRNRGWFRFATQLTKRFFAASFLRPFAEEKIYVHDYMHIENCTPQFLQEVYSLLRQITFTDLEPLFEEVHYE